MTHIISHLFSSPVRFGQLGHGKQVMGSSQPRKVMMELLGETCLQICCGTRHTVALLAGTPYARVVVFGGGMDGQLGVGEAVNRALQPVVVNGRLSMVYSCYLAYLLDQIRS